MEKVIKILKMKNLKILLFFYLISCFAVNTYAQDKEFQTKIITFARYINSKGVELRIIPEKKYILTEGIKNGFVVERADANSNNYQQIGYAKAFTEEEWQALIASKKDEEAKKQIQMVHFFYENLLDRSQDKIDFSKGIEDLVSKKSNEDFTFMIFLLSALENNDVAKALGLSFVDKTAVKGKTYKYRAKLKNKTKKYTVLSPSIILTAVEKHNEYKNYFFVTKGDTSIGFYWEEIPELHGFDIERANAGSSKFVKLNKAPIYTLSGDIKGKTPYGYLDKNLINYKKYTYRFYAHSVFGERIKLFEMTTFPVDLTPPPMPKMYKPTHKSPNEVLISWELKNTPKDFKGFAVARSAKNRGKFTILHQKLLPKGTHTFIDKTFSRDKINYYIVQAIDTANNVSSTTPFSVVLTDSIPPKKPIIKSVKIEKNGIATLSIQLNKEKDLMGYRIFRANSKKHEFSAIQESFVDLDSTDTKVKTVFKDTISLNSLTKNIFYRVKALDFNYNQSDFSEIFAVKRPDTIPPSIPVFKKIKAYEDKIELQLALSKSRDVKSHYLYRKTNINSEWKQLSTLQNDADIYIDKDVQKGVTYYYTLRAKDTSGLYSKYANTVYATVIDKGILPKISNFSVVVKKDMANLNWNYSSGTSDVYFVIYKKLPNGKLKQYKQINNKHFEDRLIKKGTYEYAVKAFSKKGNRSVLSKIIKVNKH